jgi:hypothetical protein
LAVDQIGQPECAELLGLDRGYFLFLVGDELQEPPVNEYLREIYRLMGSPGIDYDL